VVNITTDVFKLVISLAMLAWGVQAGGWSPALLPDTGVELLKFSVPALLYSCKSVLQFVAMSTMNAPSFQLWRNLNIVTTGVLYHFCLGRSLDRKKMQALLLLATGLTFISYKCSSVVADDEPVLPGIIACVFISLLSGGAGVYTEMLMKKNTKSIHMQNIQLYTFSVLANLTIYFAWEYGDAKKSVMLGFYPNLIALDTALAGLAASFLLKYADNIVKVYSSGLAVIFTVVVSVYLLDYTPSVPFYLGSIVVLLSVDIYYAKSAPSPVLPTANPQQPTK